MTEAPTKVASVIGTPGMCSDDGRAITYYWRTYFNEHGGKGFSKEGPIFDTEAQAEAYCVSHGYHVTNHAWT